MEQPSDKESNEKNGKTAIDATHDGACGGKGALDDLRGPRIFMCISVEAAAGKARRNRTMVPGSPFFRRLRSETSRELYCCCLKEGKQANMVDQVAVTLN